MAMPLHQVYVPETHVLLFVLKETRCRESEHPPFQSKLLGVRLHYFARCPASEEGWLRLPWEMVGGKRHGPNATLQLGSPSTSLQGR